MAYDRIVVVHQPADEYRRRLLAGRADLERRQSEDRRLAFARLAVFGVAILLLVAAVREMVSYWVLVTPGAAFSWLVKAHDRVVRAREAAARAVAFYERGLARIEDRWAGGGDFGERFLDERHLYANDLDLFGRASLFELLSTARTDAGQRTLASWLQAAASRDTIRERQDAIRELSNQLDFREGLATAGDASPPEIHKTSLIEWGEAPSALNATPLQWISVAFATAAVGSIVMLVVTREPVPLMIALLIQGAFIWPLRHRIEQAIQGTEAAAHELDILRHALSRLERATFQSPYLGRLRHQLAPGEQTASRAIHALDRLMAMHDWHHNLVFRFLSLPLMWRLQIALGIERWRKRYGSKVHVWIGTVAEFEAVASLATYCYEHPADPFPHITRDADGGNRPLARFEGTGLGHPLLAADRIVRNDVSLDDRTRLLLVSGSNMSGKSTLLRTVGINAVMALAGAPVRATALTLSPLAVGATLRIQDSLQEGRSRFYAEISRIREIADVAKGSTPLLFLLDELFHGTNSHDRRVGASGVLRSLLDRGAIGLITTHDLALTAIADELAPRAANIHFEDSFDQGEIRFDYRARPGPVSKSNALALMRAVGLDVPAK